MVVDSSALTSIVLSETDAELYIERISRDISKANSPICRPVIALYECGIVADARGRGPQLDSLITYLAPRLIDLDLGIAVLAREAYVRFGRKGKAKLNFGDCLVYATAKHLKMPLLYKGNDFRYTDIEPAI